MGCNCKSDDRSIGRTLNNDSNKKTSVNLFQKTITYSLKFLGFLVMIMFLPLINLGVIWIIFKTLVLNKDVDFKPLLVKIGEIFYKDNDDDDDDDYEDDENLVMLNVEDITNTSK
jgi:hypothetical protein